jgi:hypothetical protein
VLRRFRLVDKFGLSDLLHGTRLPSSGDIARRLNTCSEALPAGVSAAYVSECVLASLKEPTPETVAWCTAHTLLRCELGKIRSGKRAAAQYHQHIFELLVAIFDGYLQNPHREKPINDGRGRIDITFDNDASEGFFSELRRRHDVPCDVVPFECKNYKSDLGNPEYDQLSGRLNDKRGMVGFLVCRRNFDLKDSLSHCKDRYTQKHEVILVLDDSDLRSLLGWRSRGELTALNEHLSSKYRALKM